MYAVTQGFITGEAPKEIRYKPLYLVDMKAEEWPWTWSGDIAHAKRFSKEDAEALTSTLNKKYGKSAGRGEYEYGYLECTQSR
jgi:hypothetical protein